MKYGRKWWNPMAGLVLAVLMASTACGPRTPETTSVAEQTEPTSYTAPEISIKAQPMPVGTTVAMLISSENKPQLQPDEEKPKKRSKRRRRRKVEEPKKVEKPVAEAKDDSGMGMMAADDPTLRSVDQPRSKKKDDEWKNWIEPSRRDRRADPSEDLGSGDGLDNGQ